MEQFITFIMHHWELSLALGVVLVLLLIFELRNKAQGVPQVTPQQATQLINHQDAVILDVRDNNSFTSGHIINAINIPLAELNHQLAKLEAHKSKPIIIVCKMGQNISQATALLQKQAFTQINCLQGGMQAWLGASLPVVKG